MFKKNKCLGFSLGVDYARRNQYIKPNNNKKKIRLTLQCLIRNVK